jgi:hypothetical protein
MIPYKCSVEVAGQWFEVECSLEPTVKAKVIGDYDSPDYPLKSGKMGKVENIRIYSDSLDVTDKIAGYTQAEIEAAVLDNYAIEQTAEELLPW